MTYGLTPRQRDALAFIKGYVAEHGSSPSFREIADALGLRSTSNVHRIVSCLEERGAINRLPSRSRSLRVLGEAA